MRTCTAYSQATRPVSRGLHLRWPLVTRLHGLFCWRGSSAFLRALLNTLFLPWIDTGKSYRSVFVSMQQSVPAQYRCMSSRNLGDSQRALLLYFSNIVTHRDEVASRRRNCDLLLIQGIAREEATPPGWRKIWECARPGDKVERYRLYRRSSR